MYGFISRLVLSGEPNALNLLSKILDAFAQVFHPDSKATAETKAVVRSCLQQLTNDPQGQIAIRTALTSCSAETAQMIENSIR